MIKRYELNNNSLPNMPCVHDCIIKEVHINEDFLIFIFEDDISYHDSIKYISPNSKSLIIRYHLIDIFNTYKWKHKLSLTKGEGFILEKNDSLIKMAEDRLEYLYHSVGYQTVMLKLWSKGSIIVDISADYVEYDWK
ncbi:MAG: hypothetical protein RR337_13045 [Clostridia bacterium]